MYIVEEVHEAEIVANALLKSVKFVIVSGIQFHNVESIAIIRQPDDLENIVISINLPDNQHAIVNYYEFERKCHFNTLYSDSSALIIGINDLTADEITEYEKYQSIEEEIERKTDNAAT